MTDEPVIVASGARWRIARTATGAYRVQCRSHLEEDAQWWTSASVTPATPSDALVDDARAKDKRRGTSDFTLDAGELPAISPTGPLRYAPRTRRTVSMARATPARERRARDSAARLFAPRHGRRRRRTKAIQTANNA